MLLALSPFDIGQAVIVIDGHVVAVEDIEGTDGLLARVARLRGEGRIRARSRQRRPGEGAQDAARTCVSTCRPSGPRTVEGARPRGWPGSRSSAGNAIVAEPQAMIDGGGRRRRLRHGFAGVMQARAPADVARRIVLIATEESGDRLGANLMKVLRQRLGGAVRFEGVGGRAMAREGLASLFPIEELSIIGLAGVVRQLPKILRLIRQTADAVLQASPDALVIIDSPDFTHRVARRVRARDPSIPIVDYVSPSVWAWRPGRARAMRRYVDHVLALLPFEPEAYRRLRGPPCSYVGHPLVEQIATLRPDPAEQARRDAAPPVLLVLPGSRRSEIRHHMAVFGETLGRLQAQGLAVRADPADHAASAGGGPRGREELAGPAANRGRRAGQAGGVPDRACRAGQVGHRDARTGAGGGADGRGLRVGSVEAWVLRRAIQHQFGHPGQSRDRRERRAGIRPAGLHAGKTGAGACATSSADSPLRRRQREAFARLDAIMSTGDQPPSVRAADIVLATMRKARRDPEQQKARPAAAHPAPQGDCVSRGSYLRLAMST